MIGGIFVGHVNTPVPQTPVVFGSYSPTGGGTYRTGQSIGTSDTTLKLSSFKEPVSNIPYTMSYLGSDIEYITISPQSSISEFASFSGISQNSDGSATLTGLVRGISRTPGTGGCVASTTLAQSHAGQSIVILSNPPCQLAEYLPLRTIATSSAATVIASTSPWHYDYNPNWILVGSTSLASKGYVDSTAAAGAAPITTSVAGIGILATAAQAAASTATAVYNAITYNLLLPASIATTTPSAETKNVIPVTGTNQKLSQSFFDLTQVFTFLNNLIAPTSTLGTLNVGTLNASSTINLYGNTNVNGNLTISASSVVTGLAGKFYVNTSPGQVQSSGTTASTTIISVSIPANTLGTTNFIDFKIYESSLSIAASSNGVYFEIGYGTGTTTIFYAGGAGTVTAPGIIDVLLAANGATGSQQTAMIFPPSTSSTLFPPPTSNGTLSQDSTATKQFTVVVRYPTSTGANQFLPYIVTGVLSK